MCNDQSKQCIWINMSKLLINLTQLWLSLAKLSPSLFMLFMLKSKCNVIADNLVYFLLTSSLSISPPLNKATIFHHLLLYSPPPVLDDICEKIPTSKKKHEFYSCFVIERYLKVHTMSTDDFQKLVWTKKLSLIMTLTSVW